MNAGLVSAVARGEKPSQGAPWTVLLAIAAAIAVLATLFSSSRPYDERLVDLAARRNLPEELYRAAGGDALRQAQFLDLLRDPELSLELRLAAERYGSPGKGVLDLFASEPAFQDALRAYGDGVVPVIAFFVEHDVRSLRALAWLKSKVGADDDAPYVNYGPEARGRRAIQMIGREGHRFLAQFSIDSAGIAHWNQTERATQLLADFLAGGVRNLETKHDLGEDVGTLDVLSASADVFVPIASVKALKLFKAARAAGATGATGATGAAAAAGAGSRVAATKATGLALHTRLLGSQVLKTSRVGRAALKLGLVASTGYLVVRHPSLLNSMFEEIGRALGLPAWLAKLIGWTIVAAPVLMLVGPTLTMAALFLVPAVRGLAWVGRSLSPRRSRTGGRPQAPGA